MCVAIILCMCVATTIGTPKINIQKGICLNDIIIYMVSEEKLYKRRSQDIYQKLQSTPSVSSVCACPLPTLQKSVWIRPSMQSSLLLLKVGRETHTLLSSIRATPKRSVPNNY